MKRQDTGYEKGNRTFCARCLIRLDMLGRGTPQKRKYPSRDLKLKGGECRCPGPKPPGIDSSTPSRTPRARAALSTGQTSIRHSESHPPLSPHPLPEGCCGRRRGQWEPRLGGRGSRERIPYGKSLPRTPTWHNVCPSHTLQVFLPKEQIPRLS